MAKTNGLSNAQSTEEKRRRILGALAGKKPMSVRDISHATGMPVSVIYGHLRLLVEGEVKYVEKIKLPATARKKKNFVFKSLKKQYQSTEKPEQVLEPITSGFYNPFRMSAQIIIPTEARA